MEAQPPTPALTPREREVLDAVGRRLTNPEIAAELVVSLRTVESHVAALRRKLGAGTRADLRAAAGSRPAPGPGALRLVPAPAGDLVGREAERDGLRAALARHRLVTVTGAVGCGKSRVALEAAAGRRGGLLDVDGAGPDLPSALAAALGLPVDGDDAVGVLALALDAGEQLVLLDDCDARRAECLRLARDLLRRTTRLVVLCTSRSPLGAPEEVVLAVAPLTGEPARVRAAVELFRRRALAAGAREGDLDPAVVERVCARLDGLPLAVELAAARCSTVPVAELEALLAQGVGALGRPGPRGDRHRTLAHALDRAVGVLDDPARRVLVALCALPAPPALAHVDGVLGAGALPHVLALVDDSLAWSGRDRAGVAVVGVLRTVREHVLGTAATDDVEAVRDAWCRRVEQDATRLAARAVGEDGPTLHQAWRSLAQALPWVLRRLAGTAPTRAAGLARAAGVLCEQLGPDAATGAAVAALVDEPVLVDAVPLEDVDVVGDALIFGHLDAAAVLADRAARRPACTPAGRAAVARLVGTVALQQGRAQDAVGPLRAAASLAADHGDVRRRAQALQGLAMAAAQGPDHAATWRAHEEAMAAYAQAGDAMHVNNVRYMMCHRAAVTGDRLREAAAWAQQCVDYATETANAHELAHARLVRAELEPAAGAAVAQPVSDELAAARATFADLGDARCLTRALLVLAEGATAGQQVGLLEQAWAAARRSGHRELLRRSGSALAAALHTAGRTRDAGLVLGGLAATVGEAEALAAAPDADVDWSTLLAEGAARVRARP